MAERRVPGSEYSQESLRFVVHIKNILKKCGRRKTCLHQAEAKENFNVSLFLGGEVSFDPSTNSS